MWASFNWVRQVDPDTALEQQERLTEIVEAGQLVVKTAAIDEAMKGGRHRRSGVRSPRLGHHLGL